MRSSPRATICARSSSPNRSPHDLFQDPPGEPQGQALDRPLHVAPLQRHHAARFLDHALRVVAGPFQRSGAEPLGLVPRGLQDSEGFRGGLFQDLVPLARRLGQGLLGLLRVRQTLGDLFPARAMVAMSGLSRTGR